MTHAAKYDLNHPSNSTFYHQTTHDQLPKSEHRLFDQITLSGHCFGDDMEIISKLLFLYHKPSYQLLQTPEHSYCFCIRYGAVYSKITLLSFKIYHYKDVR